MLRDPQSRVGHAVHNRNMLLLHVLVLQREWCKGHKGCKMEKET